MPLRRFFDRYAEFAQRPAHQELAAMYAQTFVIAGPEGSRAFANDAAFLDWLTQVYDFNQTHGMRSLVVVSIYELVLSPRHSLATVKWGTQFTKTGDRLIEFEISYLVESGGGGWTILSYISRSDQDGEMKRLGVL